MRRGMARKGAQTPRLRSVALPRAAHVAPGPFGDRPNPRAPPHPCRDGGPRRRAESSLDSGTVRSGRHATTRRGSPGPLRRTSVSRPRCGDVRRARPSHRGVRSVPAATGRRRKTPFGRPPRRGGRRSAGRCGRVGPRLVGDCAERSPDIRPTPFEFPIPWATRPQLLRERT